MNSKLLSCVTKTSNVLWLIMAALNVGKKVDYVCYRMRGLGT